MIEEKINAEKLFFDVLKKIDCVPNHVIVPNVAIHKGDELKGFYCIGNKAKSYLREEEARSEMKNNDQLYKVDIERLE